MIEIEPVSGWKGRVVQCERVTVAHYEIAAGASEVHEHDIRAPPYSGPWIASAADGADALRRDSAADRAAGPP